MTSDVLLRDVTAGDLPIFYHNIASLRVLEKCGFTICGEDSGSPGDPVEEFILKLSANESDEAH